MRIKSIIRIIGRILILEGALMILPVIVALIYKENTALIFLSVGASLVVLGFLTTLIHKDIRKIRSREGLVTVGLSWIVVSFFAAVPLVLTGAIPNLLDAFFETVSGFTTTGCTILTEIETLPRSCLFWRSMTHWIGGMGVLVFVMAILPGKDTESMHLMRAEVPGPEVGKIVSKLRFTATLLYLIYMALTVSEAILLAAGGMPVYDAVVNALSTAGTGGFAVKNASIAGYNSLYSEIVITAFMFLFSVNFSLYYLLLAGNVTSIFKNKELRVFVIILVSAMLLVTFNIMPLYNGSFGDALRYASFQVMSITSTAGFVTADFNLWPTFSKAILIVLMFVGACAGSTGGGMKVSRIIVIVKNGIRGLKKQLFPRSVHPVTTEGKLLDPNTGDGISMYVSAYAALFAFSFVIVSLDRNLDFTESLSALIACINNVGPGLGKVGAVGNMACISPLTKIILMIDMLAGRLDVFPILAIILPTAWKKSAK